MTTEFFTSAAALKRHFETRSRQKAFPGGGAEDARAWQAEAREALREILGLNHLAATAPNAVLRATVQEAGYVREEWRIETEEAVSMPFSLLIPDGLTQPAPLVICPHGHGSGGRAMVAGRRDLPGISEAITQYRGDYGVQFAPRRIHCGLPRRARIRRTTRGGASGRGRRAEWLLPPTATRRRAAGIVCAGIADVGFDAPAGLSDHRRPHR